MPSDRKPVDIVILCGGLGRRLRPVYSDGPKPMAGIDGTPFLRLQVDWLAKRGFHSFVLCAGHKGQVIEAYFRECCAGLSVETVVESRPLGTGGALVNALRRMKTEEVIVLNGDSFCNLDFDKMQSFFHERGRKPVIAVASVDDASEYGTMELDSAGRILRFREKIGNGQGWVNAGVYVFSTDDIKSFPRRVPLSLEREVFPSLIGSGCFAYPAQGPLIDIGTPERYEAANRELLQMMQKG